MDEHGWYEDPSGRHQYRWWDGLSWTSYVGDDGEIAVDDTTDEETRSPIGLWSSVWARPLWARIAAVLVIVGAIVAVYITLGADDDHAATVEIIGFEPGTTTAPARAEPEVPSTAPRKTAPIPAPTAKPSAAPVECDHNYRPCVPIASDVDCAGGSGDGPAYVQGPVRVIASDVYDLDPDGDGIGCDR